MIETPSPGSERSALPSSEPPDKENRLVARAPRSVSWQTLALALAFLVYVAYWSWLTIRRYYALNAYVYDLGSNVEEMWLYWHQSWTLVQVTAQVFDQGIQYLVSPVIWMSSYPALLVLQSILVGSSCFAIYGIGSHLLKNRTEGWLLSIAYLMFFPLAGANWLDFEFLGLFAPLLLFGYLAYLKRHYATAFVLLALIGFIRFPFAIFPLLFGILVVAGAFDDPARESSNQLPGPRYGLVLMVFSIALLAGGLLVSVPTIYSGELALDLHIVGSAGPSVNTVDILLTFILVLAPVLFLPLFSTRWVIFLGPYAVVALRSRFWAYAFPYAFRWQYAPTLVPIVFLGAMDILSNPHPLLGNPLLRRLKAVRWFRSRWDRTGRRAAVITILAVTMATALFLEPYGPFNSSTFNTFDTSSSTSVNSTEWHALNALVGLIPPDNPYVMFQDNMPEVLPRPQVYPTMMVPGLGIFGSPVTSAEAMNGTYPMVQNGQWTVVRADYVICDPLSWTYAYGQPSMADFVSVLYSSGAYGIVGEADGMLLLEHNYEGPVRYYSPFEQTILASQLQIPVDGPVFGHLPISFTDTGGDAALWNGPYWALSPGQYDVRLVMETSNTSRGNQLQLQVLSGSQARTVVLQQPLFGTDFSSPDVWQIVDIKFYVNASMSYLQVIARSLGWSGVLSLQAILLDQLAPGSTTFRVGNSPSDAAFYQLLNSLPPSASVVVQPGFQLGVLNRTIWNTTAYNPSYDAQYILGDPYGYGFSSPTSSQNHSMAALMNDSLNSGSYSVAAEISGVTLLERGPLSSLTAFTPLNLTFSTAELFQVPEGTPFEVSPIVASNTSGDVPLWDGPYSFLVPGTYILRFEMEATNTTPSNQLLFQVLAGPTARVVIAQQEINGSNFTRPDQWQEISVIFTVLSVYDYAQYIARSIVWSGTLELDAITLVETSALGT